MKLTIDQEKVIEDFVDAQGLTIQTLRDDVIDHLCCVVESELGKDNSFEQLLDKAINELAPNGLIKIQHRTIFLLNVKRIMMMKKLMYLIGFMGSITLTAGVTFKLLMMPFATELFMVGFLTLFLVFVPLVAIDLYKVSLSQSISARLKIILGLLAAVVSGLSGLFKIMHLQGADLLLMLGAFVFACGFLPFYFFNMYKRSIS